MKNSDMNFDARKYMKMAIDIMNKSIQEPRKDKVSPKVGALLIKPDGSIETAYRGELRHGDHAEFTLLERKNRSIPLDGAILFATLEPCAPGSRNHPKLGCAERIVNARIKKVWIGVEDPDPTVDRKGIKYLIDNGIEVEMFDSDLQATIWKANIQFKKEAEERAKRVKQEELKVFLSPKEKGEILAELDDFSEDRITNFIKMAKLNVAYGSDEFKQIFSKLGLLESKDGSIIPTGLGLLLFGTNPQLIYQNALIRATYKTKGRGEDIDTIGGPLVDQADKIQNWYESRIGKQIDRSKSKRKVIYDYPLVVFREAIINAIVHRDYDISGAPIYFEINDDAIIIKSPGEPVPPLKMEQIKKFSAPSLSRNPKIMYVFDQLELVEQRGLGFQTLKELPEKFGLPLPLVSYDPPYMVMKFPRSGEAIKNLDSRDGIQELNDEELKGYDFIKLSQKLTRKEYESHFKIEKKKAERHFKRFVKFGLVERKGSGPSTYYEIITT